MTWIRSDNAAAAYSWRFRAYYNSLLRLQIRRAARIIVPSEATLDAVTHRFPGAPVVLIPQGIDDVFFAPGTQRCPPSAPPMILYTGGYGYRERVGDLLRAFELVRSRYPEASLVLTGRPPEGLATSIALVAGSNRIETTGIVSDTELARLYRRAAVVAYPSGPRGVRLPSLGSVRERCARGRYPIGLHPRNRR